ncbi:MAG: hypothetical protein ACREOU_03865 [Candidatus Eiseniibacteriota bacterium]
MPIRRPFEGPEAVLALTVTLLTVASLADSAPAVNPSSSFHVSYVIGLKMLESGWDPVADQLEFGIVDLDFRPRGWPFSPCVQVLTTYAPAVPSLRGLTGEYCGVWEINLGARTIREVSDRWKPFLGAGVSYLGGSVSSYVVPPGSPGFQVIEDSDANVGVWGSGGFYRYVSRRWHIGLEVQYSWGEITLFDEPLRAGGLHALAMVGYHR